MSDKIETHEEKPNTEIAIVDEKSIRDKIYTVRGVQVMLDFELAELYGYETKNFNRQVKNNVEKFEGDDFMFKLTRDEFHEILRCKNFTSSWGGTRYLPYAFTEQGVYMLMTVLRGELAVKQSRALVIAFKSLKDYIVQNQPLIAHHDYLRLSMQVSDSQQTIQIVQKQLIEHGEKLNGLFEEMQETVKRSEISPYLLDFTKQEEQREYLILNGQPAKADERVFHCGASSKDAGVHLMTVISEMTDPDFISTFGNVINTYMGNPILVLT